MDFLLFVVEWWWIVFIVVVVGMVGVFGFWRWSIVSGWCFEVDVVCYDFWNV